VHPVIDGSIFLHGQLGPNGIRIEEIREVEVVVYPLVLELTGKTAPKDGLEAKFSVYHGAAVGILFGKATPAQYEDAVVNDERVVGLRGRVRATVDENLRPDEAFVIIRVPNGGEGDDDSVTETHIDHAVGSRERPMSVSQLTDKFVDQCVPVLGQERTQQASQWCWELEKQIDVRQIKTVL
jgi:aconitate decarboxylase